MNLENGVHYLFVFDRAYLLPLLQFKRSHPLADIKLMDKEQLLDELSFSYDKVKDPLVYLLSKEEYDYNQVKKLLHILRVGDLKKNPRFESIYEDLLSQGYLKKDPYGLYALRSKKIFLFESEEDLELQGILKRNSLAFDYLTFKDIGLPNKYGTEERFQPITLDFENKEEQYFYIFSDIRRRLALNPQEKDRILLLVQDESDLFYVSHFSKLFSLPILTTIRTSYMSDIEVHQNLLHFHAHPEENFALLNEAKPGTPLAEVKKNLQHYHLDQYRNKNLAYADLMEILSSQGMNFPYDNQGIRLTDQFTFSSQDLIYVTCFQHDVFYQEAEDDNLISDKELEEMSANPSYVKTKMDRRLKANYLNQNEILLLSRPLFHLQDKIYDSQFLKEFSWHTLKADYFLSSSESKTIHQESELEEYFYQNLYRYHKDKSVGPLYPLGLYTEEAKKLLDGLYFDHMHAKANGEYRTYSHKFVSFTPKNKKRVYSATLLENFYLCPYYCYLENILNLSNNDKDQDKTMMRIGLFAHKVFEDVYTHNYADFDQEFEVVFQKGVEAYRTERDKDGNPVLIDLTPKDEEAILLLKPWLKLIVKHVRNILSTDKDHQPYSHIIHEKAEQPIRFDLEDKQGNTYAFKGRIDKLLYTQGDNGNRFVTLIDYKTGKSGDFDMKEVCVGGSLQLPLYAYALSQKENEALLEGSQFAGFGIQHIYFSSIYDSSKDKNCITEDNFQKKLRIGEGGGIEGNDEDYLLSIDRSAYDVKKDKADNSSALFLNVKNGYSLYEDPSQVSFQVKKTSYSLKNLYEDAINSALKTADRIRIGDFPISPTVLGDSDNPQCTYCPYKDICYHSKKDIKSLEDDIRKRFEGLTESEEE